MRRSWFRGARAWLHGACAGAVIRGLMVMGALALGGAGVLAPVAALTIAGSPPPIVAAQSGLATTPLTISTASGKHRYTVELAVTPDQQQIGMMFRKTMPRDHGMIFPFATPRVLTFWMENTYLPLDLIFIGSDGKVVSISADAKPMSREVLSSGVPANAVLELNAGEAARIGLKAGDGVAYKAAK